MKKSEALAYFKTQSALAAALSLAGYQITQPAISKWGELVPEVPARIISEITNGDLVFSESFYRAKPAA